MMKTWIVILVLFQAGCSTLPTHKPLAPEVNIVDVNIIKLGLSRQELAFSLSVFNPNAYDLPVNTLEFIASHEQQDFASGSSHEPILLAADTHTTVTINVTARANRMLRKLISSFINKDSQLDYNVAGFVKLDNWPARIPFNVDRVLSLDDS